MLEAEFYATVEPLNRALRELAQKVGRAMPDLVRQSGRTLARTLAEDTHPRGPFAQARKRGQMAAQSDVYRVYVSPQTMVWKIQNARLRKGSRGSPEGVASAFAAALSSGDGAKAERLLRRSGIDERLGLHNVVVGVFDGGGAHELRRSRATGRVQGKVPSMVVMEERGLAEYQKNLARGRVGRAKGAWADCSRQMGSTRGFPAWLVKVGMGTGRVDERMNDSEPHVILHALPSYMSRVISEREIARAGHVAAGKMTKMVRIVLEKEARRV